MSRQIVVVGAGVTGLCCAYYLNREGWNVTVIESNRVGSGSSFANGGWLCPAQAGPLPEPGLTLQGMRALLNRDSALYFDPSNWRELAPWLLRFWTYCNASDHRCGTAAIAKLGEEVFALIDELSSDGVKFELHKQGMVYAASRAEDARAELRKLEPMRELGYELPDDILVGPELSALEPALSSEITAGFLVNQHWHVKSDTFTTGLAEALRRRGVVIVEGAEVVEFGRSRSGTRIELLRTAAGDFPVEQVLVATGSWTAPLTEALGVAVPVLAGKGYSFSVKPSLMPRHAVLLVDVHVGCTPFEERLRIGGTMEFSGINSRLDHHRIEKIMNGAKRAFLPFDSGEIDDQWAGMRPVTVDGLPVLDRALPYENLYLATGGGMQGVTLAPPAGRAMAQLIGTGVRPTVLEPFRLDRFRRSAFRHAISRGAK